MKAYAAADVRRCGPADYYTADALAEHFDGREAGPYIINGAALLRHLEGGTRRHKIGPYTFTGPHERHPSRVIGAENTDEEGEHHA